MVADFEPVHKGLECFASEDRKGGSTDKYLLSAEMCIRDRNTSGSSTPGANGEYYTYNDEKNTTYQWTEEQADYFNRYMRWQEMKRCQEQLEMRFIRIRIRITFHVSVL